MDRLHSLFFSAVLGTVQLSSNEISLAFADLRGNLQLKPKMQDLADVGVMLVSKRLYDGTAFAIDYIPVTKEKMVFNYLRFVP
jgi:hypothetical protein